MNDANPYRNPDAQVFRVEEGARAGFLRRTYLTLFTALGALIVLLIGLFQTPLPDAMLTFLAGGSWRWLLFLGAFMILGSLASNAAARVRSLPAQFLALGAYVLLEGLILLPLLLVAQRFAGPEVIESAAFVTLAAFAALTAVVFITGKDFSFLRGIVVYGMLLALIAIVAAVIFGWVLGTWFMVAMVALAGAMILYQTSNVLHHYPEDRYVAGALALFAAVALLFWYVLQLFLAGQD